jgi:hypothetical protein
MPKLAVCLLALASVAGATESAPSTPPSIDLHDLPGTDGNWQEGVAVVAAPATQVRGWLTDYDHWPELFSDITEAKQLGRTEDGRAVVRFYSRIAGRMLTISERETEWGLEYEGGSRHVNFRGKIFIEVVDPQTTRVRMQSTSDVHGMLAPFVTRGMKRSKAFDVTRSDLRSLLDLSQRL